MTFLEIDLLGVYVAPISLLIIAAWFVTIALPDRGPLRLAGLRVASGGVRVRRVQARQSCAIDRSVDRLRRQHLADMTTAIIEVRFRG